MIISVSSFSFGLSEAIGIIVQNITCLKIQQKCKVYMVFFQIKFSIQGDFFALLILAIKQSVLSWRLNILSNAIHNFFKPFSGEKPFSGRSHLKKLSLPSLVKNVPSHFRNQEVSKFT